MHSPALRLKLESQPDLLGSIATRKKATPAQIALAWPLAQKPSIVHIPGTRKLNRLQGNLAAATIDLTTDDLRELDDVASKITVRGIGPLNTWSS
ncbi:aldo/keto reductase [Methylococcus mesophilus]|uniref:aldo/keto reductase n=1 Tax=Methylococcus mesophilus TaxID=2993564 RepID=UPI00374493DE